MSKRQLPSPEVLRQLLRYEPETGKLFWLKNKFATPQWNGKFPGREAICHIKNNGYASGAVMSIGVYAHRVIWAMVNGAWPDEQIDHINGCRHDNRQENLRAASRQQNSWNSIAKSSNKSGFKGVHFHKLSGKWRAQITINGKTKCLGLYESPVDASSAYLEKAKKIHGKFARII